MKKTAVMICLMFAAGCVLGGCEKQVSHTVEPVQAEGLDGLSATLIFPQQESEAAREIIAPIEAEVNGEEEETEMTVAKATDIYNQPSQDAAKLGNVNRGAKVSVLGLSGEEGWYKVNYNGRVAYVQANTIGEPEIEAREVSAERSVSGNHTTGNQTVGGQTTGSQTSTGVTTGISSGGQTRPDTSSGGQTRPGTPSGGQTNPGNTFGGGTSPTTPEESTSPTEPGTPGETTNPENPTPGETTDPENPTPGETTDPENPTPGEATDPENPTPGETTDPTLTPGETTDPAPTPGETTDPTPTPGETTDSVPTQPTEP